VKNKKNQKKFLDIENNLSHIFIKYGLDIILEDFKNGVDNRDVNFLNSVGVNVFELPGMVHNLIGI
jgi:hypothetical protein